MGARFYIKNLDNNPPLLPRPYYKQIYFYFPTLLSYFVNVFSLANVDKIAMMRLAAGKVFINSSPPFLLPQPSPPPLSPPVFLPSPLFAPYSYFQTPMAMASGINGGDIKDNFRLHSHPSPLHSLFIPLFLPSPLHALYPPLPPLFLFSDPSGNSEWYISK